MSTVTMHPSAQGRIRCWVTGEPILIPESASQQMVAVPGLPQWLGPLPVIVSREGLLALDAYNRMGLPALPDGPARRVLAEAQSTAYALRLMGAIAWLAEQQGAIGFDANGVLVSFLGRHERFRGTDPLNVIFQARAALEAKEQPCETSSATPTS